ncbi:uncharacterized protein MONBRDRAFT_29653 [Monosiga brevicollis MX1]|uniref:Uncharacterized protein n=1 Tax=Monosiga brevicollis TaxID=81824 RepID=A9VBQ9_MONBE|nr:uncharacterized protein MONBRDRAFT_29653 [Monosiga brevicollis MX1]EDQ84976.1 predicted protein [Monosiga brevicollis MX1]|eukprot:XP_001750146.1 hypothetical protein [Monosiga brevicollis MX1]
MGWGLYNFAATVRLPNAPPTGRTEQSPAADMAKSAVIAGGGSAALLLLLSFATANKSSFAVSVAAVLTAVYTGVFTWRAYLALQKSNAQTIAIVIGLMALASFITCVSLLPQALGSSTPSKVKPH